MYKVFDRMRIGLKFEASLATVNEWLPVPTERQKMQLTVDLVLSWACEIQVYRNMADSGALPDLVRNFHTGKSAAWNTTSYRLLVVIC